MKIRKRCAILLLFAMSFVLSGCSSVSIGTGGGILPSFIQKPLYEECRDTKTTTSSIGKTAEIDGVELKLPIDWNYGFKETGSDFNGINYEGDDSARGIGIFNVNEGAGNDPTYSNYGSWKDTYAINMRWEYAEYGYSMGVYPAHERYKGSDSSGQFEVGGTSASCVSGGRIVGYNSIPGSGDYLSALLKARIVVYNPENGKACVCGVGLSTVGSSNPNWGGAPLSLIGGITPAVNSVVQAEQNKTVLECYFADPGTELGECDFDSGDIKKTSGSRSGSNCDESIAASSIEELAVGVAYDKSNPKYPGHEMVMRQGWTGLSPTTDAAIDLRMTTAGDKITDDCGKFVASAMIACVDPDYPIAGTDNQYNYLKKSKDKYTEVLTTTDVVGKADLLEPGDILIRDGHTYLYVGNEAIKSEFKYISNPAYSIVEASLSEHGPEIRPIYNDGKLYTAFRFKGTPQPHPAFAAQMSGGSISDGKLSNKQKRLISKANGASTPWPGSNWCAAWVGNVFDNAGLKFNRGNANDVWARDCKSNNKSNLKPGMIIASNRTPGEAGQRYGHIGIYIGNGMVAESIYNGVKTTPLESFISWNESAGGAVKWGWAAGVDLSK